MQFRIVKDAPASVRAAALVLPVFTGDTTAPIKDLDSQSLATISEMLSGGEYKGKLTETVLVHAPDKPYKRVLLVGLGDAKDFAPHMLARYAGTAVRYLGRRNIRDIAIALPAQAAGNEIACGSLLAEGALTGSFDTTVYQKNPERRSGADSITILAGDCNESALQTGIDRGQILGEAVNVARKLAITPANDMTPSHLADAAKEIAKENHLEVEIWDEDRCRKEGMGSFLSVAQGSSQPPKFIILKYNGDPGSKELLALVGKGITFDSGGISIKPAERMEEMKYDMSGAAGVIASMGAIAKLKLKINVVGLAPATENMPGGKATKPGDIFTAMNGKTIEVINTDAEGRLILADALCYANKLGATKVIDAATLTGSCVIALGHTAAAAVSNNDEFVQQFLNAVKPTGERYWQMPLYSEYGDLMKSDIADLKNTGGRPAGTLTASAFLKAFIDPTPWVHLDIAGTAYLDSESAWQAKGPTGAPVRAFVAMAEKLASSAAREVSGDGAKVKVPS